MTYQMCRRHMTNSHKNQKKEFDLATELEQHFLTDSHNQNVGGNDDVVEVVQEQNLCTRGVELIEI